MFCFALIKKQVMRYVKQFFIKHHPWSIRSTPVKALNKKTEHRPHQSDPITKHFGTVGFAITVL